METCKFYTVREVCDQLKVSPQVIYTLVKRGDLAAVRVSDRLIRISVEDLEEYVKTRNPGTQATNTAPGLADSKEGHV